MCIMGTETRQSFKIIYIKSEEVYTLMLLKGE